MASLNKKFTYIWSGINTKNQKLSGEIEAFSKNFAKANLSQQGIQVTTIQKKRWNLKRISSLDITIFFRQFASLVSAGIPVLQSLDILHDGQNNLLLKSILRQLKKDIQIGKGLANGLQNYSQYFNPISCHLVHAGEQSGTLEIMLNRSAHYQEKNLRLKKQIHQAFFYPCVIFLMAIFITMIMLIFIVPRFEELFQNIHSNLPLLTKMVIFISHCIREKFFWGLLIVAGIHGCIYYFKRTINIQSHIDYWILKFPFIHTILQKIIIARFARSLAILFGAGIPIIEALKIAAYATGNRIYTATINQLSIDITKGQQLHSAMQQYQLFPNLTIQMIKTGEESGTLEKMLEKTADLYESETDHIITNLSRLLEPLIMLILGALIGGLVIAMYLPIFKLGTTI